jgi:hypothetical protein
MHTLPDISLSDDSPVFAAEARSRISAAVADPGVASVFIVRIRGWFGPRWLAFSGKALGALGVSRSDITVPPFVPARITSLVYLTRGENGSFQEAPVPFVLHPRQPSGRNLSRHLRTLAPSTAFFWVSTGTNSSGRGAFMAYVPSGALGHTCQYIGFGLSPSLHVTVRAVAPHTHGSA